MSSNSKYKTLAKDTGLFAISNFGSKILIFLLTPLYTSILSTEEFGIADLITTTINFVYPVLTLAIADATLRFALDKSVSKRSVLGNSLLLTLLSIFILCLFTPVSTYIGGTISQYWKYFIIIYGLFNVHNLLSNYIKGVGNTRLFAIQGIVQTISIITSNIFFLVILKTSLKGYLISLILGHIIPIILMVCSGKILKELIPFEIDKPLMKDMLIYSIPMIPTILAWAVNTSIDKYMIIGMVGLGASGIYSVAHKIPTVFTSILTIFTNAWQLSAISNYGSDDDSQFYTNIYKVLDVFSVIGCLMIIMLSKYIARFLFAKDYYVAWKYVPMLTVSAMFSCHSGFLAAAFRASKKTKSLFLSVLIGSFVNIILNFCLIRNIGVMGASIATAVSFFAVWMIRFFMVQKIITIKISYKKTIISYLLFFFSAVYTMLDQTYAHIICIASIIVISLLNIVTLKEITVKFKQIIKVRVR